MTEHKFKHSDLEALENNPLVGNYSILIVGTFNANIQGNLAEWFYGRSANKFWYLFPEMLGKPSLHPLDRNEDSETLAILWKKFTLENNVIIVDLFKEVITDLINHKDSELNKLSSDQVVPFNFEKAFKYTNFEKVMFTWKGIEKGLLKDYKDKYSEFFKKKGTSVHHLLTPSNAYLKSREFKLDQWRKSYNNE